MACAVTALPILVLFLEKLGILREALGQRVLRYASLDDLAIWAILALILLDWSRLAMQAGPDADVVLTRLQKPETGADLNSLRFELVRRAGRPR